MVAASILHADLDAFYASVEQRDDPSLRGRPVIVGGGVVLAASYEARAFGVKSAMGGAAWRRLCPQATVVTPRWPAYLEASREVFAIFRDTTPVVEKLSIDEAFLDVAGMERISGDAPAIAARLRARVREEVGLPISVGVASTRALAKVASNEAKPDGLCVVPVADELAFLHALPVERLWGVGPATTRQLHAYGLRTVSDVAALDVPTLAAILGRAMGGRLHALAHNREARRLQSPRGRRSFGAQSAGRAQTVVEMETRLTGLVDRVTRRMRAAGRAGRTVVLRLRLADFSRATRSVTLARPTNESAVVLRAARTLLSDARPLFLGGGLTLIGVTVTNLDGDAQLAMALDGADRTARDAVVDAIRDRYGPDAVQRAALLGREEPLSAWMGPGEGGT